MKKQIIGATEAAKAAETIGGTTLMTVAEVAHALRESTRTTYRRIKRGELPVRRLNRSVRVERSALAAFIASH